MTNFDKELFIEWGKVFASVVVLFVLLLLACVMCGCKTTEYVPVETVRTESIKTDSTMYLSLLQTLRNIEQMKQSSSDTTIINHYERVTLNEQGDTIGKESNTNTYKSTSREREYQRTIEILRDSVRELKAEKNVVKVDSVRVPYPVERKLTKWEQAKMDFGGIAFGGIVVAIGIIVWLAIRRRRK